MKKFALIVLGIIALCCSSADAQLLYSGRAAGVGYLGTPTISSVVLSNNTFVIGAASGTAVGTISVGTIPPNQFTGSLSLSGTNAASFQLSGTTLETNGSLSCTTFSINIVATQSGAVGSPYTQAETITCNPMFVNNQVNAFSIGNGGNGDTGHAFVLSPVEVKDTSSTALLAVSYNELVTTLTGSSITDTFGVTWGNPVCTVTATAGTYSTKTSLFVQNLGSNTGVDTISVAVGATSIQPFHYQVAVIENLQSPAADGSLCTANITPTSGGVISPGSFTPTTTSTPHLIWNYTDLDICCASVSVPTLWTPNTGFTLNASIISQQYSGTTLDTWAGETYSDPSHGTNVSITPSLTATGETASTGDAFNSVTVALAVNTSGSGTPATGIHVAKIQHDLITDWSSGTQLKSQVSFVGNLRVITAMVGYGSGNDWNISSITDSCGTWNLLTGGTAAMWYAQNCSADPNDTITITGTFAHDQNGWEIWDIQNASASSYQNSVANTAACATTQSNSPTITPGTSSGLTIAELINAFGPTPLFASGSPSGAIFHFITYTGLSDSSFDTQGSALGYLYFSSNAVQHWNWTLATAQNCWWLAATFD